MMFITGLLVGIFVGANFGLFIFALLHAGSEARDGER